MTHFSQLTKTLKTTMTKIKTKTKKKSSKTFFSRLISKIKGFSLLQIANVVFLLGNIIVVYYGIHISNKQYTISVTSGYIERYNSAEMMESKIVIEEYFSSLSKLDMEQQRDQINCLLDSDQVEDIRINMHLSNLCNLLTELGVSFRAGLIEREVLFSFGSLIPYYWDKLEMYIIVSRERASPRQIFTSFEFIKDYLVENPFWVDGKLHLED